MSILFVVCSARIDASSREDGHSECVYSCEYAGWIGWEQLGSATVASEASEDAEGELGGLSEVDAMKVPQLVI